MKTDSCKSYYLELEIGQPEERALGGAERGSGRGVNITDTNVVRRLELPL